MVTKKLKVKVKVKRKVKGNKKKVKGNKKKPNAGGQRTRNDFKTRKEWRSFCKGKRMGRRRNDIFWYGYRQIGAAMGVDERTLRRWISKAGICLPRWSPGKTGSVFLGKAQIPTLLERLLRAKVIKHIDTLERLCKMVTSANTTTLGRFENRMDRN